MLGEKYSGIAVHLGARIASAAKPDQVLVSSTVKDLVVGSGIHFEDLGPQMLKGRPNEWHLFGVVRAVSVCVPPNNGLQGDAPQAARA